jgi:DNA helicase-2/ATP-dependent DNA helicase PcrA
MSPLDALNPQQRAAAAHPGGPMLILAGAGSGKTRVITHRIAHLLERGVAPEAIVAVTFTNKAAGEMRERVATLLQRHDGAPTTLPWVGTFHAFCLRLLRFEVSRTGLRSGFVVLDSDDARSLVKACERELGHDEKVHLPQRVASKISRAKGECLEPAAFAEKVRRGGSEALDIVAAEVYPLYQQRLVTANACDFDDLLMRSVLLFEREPDVLERYQRRIVHLLVDEYQDTNPIQYRLIRLLAGGHGNACAVGDEDQSIYRFRGADIRNILAFEQDFPGTHIFRIEQNYRSTGHILGAANAVVAHNVARKGKTLWTASEDGERVLVKPLPTDLAEAQWVAQEIGRLRRDHDLSALAVLYRTNAQSRLFEESLGRAGIPHVVIGGLRFYERREVKDVLCWLRLLLNPDDDMAFERVHNVPARGIGKGTLEAVRAMARQRGQSLFAAARSCVAEGALPGRAEAALEGFLELVARLCADSTDLELPALIRHLVEEVRYRDELLKEGPEIGEDRWRNVEELASAAAHHAARENDAGLASFLSEIALFSDQDALVGEERVPLMTVHSAKGLEFDVVFLVGMEEGLFPHASSMDHAVDVEEERRLCYVGMTRARRLLMISTAGLRRVFGQERVQQESRFLRELPEAHVRREGAPRHALSGRVREGQGAIASFFGGAEILPEDVSQETPEYEPTYQRGDDELEVGGGATAPRAPRGFQKGQHVRHAKFGAGVVVKRERTGGSAFLSVYFERTGRTVKLSEAHAPLEPA